MNAYVINNGTPGAWVDSEPNPRASTSTTSPLAMLSFAAMLAFAPLAHAGNVGRASPEVDLIGSGGLLGMPLKAGAWVPVDSLEGEAANVEAVPALIDGFRKNFNFSDNALGTIFGVSRQTIYNWRTRKTTADNPDRIRVFADCLAELEEIDRAYMQRVLFYPSSSGRLVQDIFMDEGWEQHGEDGLRSLIGELAAKAKQLRDRDARTLARLEKYSSNDVS